MAALTLAEPTWERMYGAVETVRKRLLRAVRVLEDAKIPYAVVGGHAVASWVSRVDSSRVRNTYDVDILVARADVWGVELFIEDLSVKAGEGVHLLFADEKIKLDSVTATPSLQESVASDLFRVINLEALVRMKLEASRRKDEVHLVDLMNVGLIDESWPAKYPSPLKERLEAILNDPNERQRV